MCNFTPIIALLWEEFAFQIDNRDIKKQEKIILGTLRFIPKDEDAQVYEALIPTVMTTSKKRYSLAYQTYLAFATRALTPKLKRIYKKHDYPMIKTTNTSPEETSPKKKSAPAKKDVSSKKKKAPAKTERRKGIELLSDAALLKEAQLKRALKRSKQDKNIHQACGSSKRADSKSEVPNEPKGKSIDTSEGTGLKPGVPNVSTANSSESKNESWGESSDEANEQGDDEDVLKSDADHEQANDEYTESDDEEHETQDDEYVHTPEDYVPTNDETNDESKDVYEEEFERINKELYGDVNISLKDAE
ncbi:hypothetical protein Tco_1473107, partial [Tanacetum coccineum]